VRFVPSVLFVLALLAAPRIATLEPISPAGSVVGFSLVATALLIVLTAASDQLAELHPLRVYLVVAVGLAGMAWGVYALSVLPPAMLLGLVIALPAVYLTLRWLRPPKLRQHRVDADLCPDCGYDLRATESRCPECNSPVPEPLRRRRRARARVRADRQRAQFRNRFQNEM
jgi:hypothetical protein